jgi:hypothetical protein
LIPGITVAAGSGTRRLLIRAIGPTLAVFGVPSALPDPKIELYSGALKIAENDNWGGVIAADASNMAATFAQNGAFALSAGSRDSALLADLSSGSFTVQVHDKNGAAGDVLVEIYEVADSPLMTTPLTASLGVQAFTVIGKRIGNHTFYLPQLRLVETSGKGRALPFKIDFYLEGGGPFGPIPTWSPDGKVIAAGGMRDMINPNFYGDYEFEFDSQYDATDVSVVVTYMDDQSRQGSVRAVTRVVH